ncbi:ion transporter [uncultured Gulosibacter sp.]|uniref:ion transporter n=1 Tax=uncultured Gulosibacter sp. TaxID=1339167 RepID=UPI00288A6660|nr:ion transporter [uncultured Gulosibacter sp.]
MNRQSHIISTSQPTDSIPWTPNPGARGWRRKIGEFVLSSATQTAILALIVVNAIVLGLQTSPAVMSRFGTLLHIIDVFCLSVFVVELVLKIIALDRRFFRDGWNIFDFLVVAISLVPAIGPLSVLRSLRVLRVLRLANRMPQLRRIATAIISAVPGIGAIAGLMVLVFYVAAVMATSLFGERFPDWFGSVFKSLYSLFQIMTLESWSMGIVRPVMAEFPDAWLFFVPFIMVSAFVMLNLFVAVILDTMSNLGATSEGTVANPAPVVEEQLPESGSVFTTRHELVAMREELAEIRRLLAIERGELPPTVQPGPNTTDDSD